MLKIYQLIKNHWPIIAILFVSLLIFRKTFTQNLYPYPGNLLVSFNFPWYSGGWEGYDSWTVSKEFIASDAIRQDIPWRFLAVKMLKNGQLPLWNPHAFSGTPLLANLQSAVFYPANILFFLTDFLSAWSIYIAIQIPAAAFFMYLLCRSWKISKPASYLAALSYSTSSFILIWLEIGIVGHTILWLPLLIWLIDQFIQTSKLRFFLGLIISSAFLVFSGHLQTAMHTFIFTGIYWIAKLLHNKKTEKRFSPKLQFIPLIFWPILLFGLTAIQILPSLELKPLSPLADNLGRDVFVRLKTPWINALTFFAPDYLGHPASRNFWSDIYGDGTPFFGVLTLFFATFTIRKINSFKSKFLSTSALVYLTYTFPGPLYHLVRATRFQLLSTTLASRAMFIVIFCFSVLGALGFDWFQKAISSKKNRRTIFQHFMAFFIIYSLLLVVPLVLSKLSATNSIWTNQLFVSFKNTVLPFSVFLSIPAFMVIFKFILQKPKLLALALLVPPSIYTLYRTNRTLPFSPPEFFYPHHPSIEYLQQNAGINRFSGLKTAKFPKNMTTIYSLYSAEGYDTMRIREYARLIASQETKNLPFQYPKSDADFIEDGGEDTVRLMDLTGIKYFLDKHDGETKEWNPEPENFPGHEVELVWQQGQFKAYQRKTALSRAFLVGDYIVSESEDQTIDLIYDHSFDLTKKVILEEEVTNNLEIQVPKVSSVNIQTYQPNLVELSSFADTDTLLFLSDAYYPGWQAYVDGQSTKIYKANHAFRAVAIPRGSHQISFRYQPQSFIKGATLTLLTLTILISATPVIIKKTKLDW